jgi:hypothetical protein
MSKRRHAERNTAIVTQASRTGVTEQPLLPIPPAEPEPQDSLWNRAAVWITLALVFVGTAAAAVLWYDRLAEPSSPPPTPPDTSLTSPEQIVRQFAALKNANDPQAETLLAPFPQVPDKPTSAAEIRRLDAEIILHRRFQVLAVRPAPSAPDGLPRFVLVLKGSVSSEPMIEKTPDGPKKGQRILIDPDVLVEVGEDDLIHGIDVHLHEEPPAKQRPRR